MTIKTQNNIQEITSAPDSLGEYFHKIWKYKALIWVFAKRDLQVKYAQTFLGVSWSLIQPLTALLIFTFFFGYVLHWSTNDLPYPLYVLSGLLGWNFFSYIVQSGATSTQESAHLIKKVYFPKSILPFSKVVVASVELSISLLLLIPLMIFFDIVPSWKIIFSPLVLIFNAVCALVLVFWVAAFAYKKRDLFHILPFIVSFGMWLTPVFFSTDLLPYKFRPFMDLNPMANVVNMWRWMLFGTTPFNFNWLISFVIVILLCLMGMFLYNTKENKFSDFA